jgi:GGDEF domain-containing protein
MAEPAFSPSSSVEEGIAAMVTEVLTLAAGSCLGEDLDRRFKSDRELECIVITTAGKPTHLVTREHYYALTGGPYGFTLFQKKPAEAVGKTSPLVVAATAPIRQLTRFALDRPREEQYDPIVVTGADGAVLGIVTLTRLIQRAAELEVRMAQLSNPLTHLPGSRLAQEWIEHGLAEDHDGGLTVIFIDLDRFKEFNDVYGLLIGDDMVRRTADVLSAGCELLGPEAQLSHAGGDDFVIVSRRPPASDALREICARFDREKLSLFRPEDVQRGFFHAADERGHPIRVPLTTLSLVGLTSASLGAERHPAVFSQRAAGLRRQAKTLAAALGRSSFILHDGWPESTLC